MERELFLQTDFSRGELSPKFGGRTETEVYQQGVSVLRNFITYRQGGIEKAPGTRYIRDAINQNRKSVLIPFEMAAGKNYVLEISHNSMTVYLNGAVVPGGTGIASPWEEDDLYKIQWVRIRREVYMACEGYKVHKLRWDGTDAGWLFVDVNFAAGDSKAITDITQADPAVVTSNGHGYTDGQEVYIDDVGGMTEINGKVYTVTNPETNTFELKGVDSSGYTAYTSGGTVKYVGAGFVDEPQRYPRGVAFMENRLILFSTPANPQTVWGSKTGSYEDFLLGANDADAWGFTIASGENEELLWAVGKDVLLIGTSQGEHILTGRGQGITPTSVFTTKQTPFGSEPIRGLIIDDALVFVQKGGRILREYYYRDERQAYTSPELTFFSDHVFDTPVVQMSFQRRPDPVLWCVTEGGKLVGVTYDHNYNIAGFHVHETDGVYESVAVVPSGGGEDLIYVSVLRSGGRYIEVFAPRHQPDIRHAVYTHSAVQVSMGDQKAITGITKADPAVVTSAGHGFSNGDKVRLEGVGGMLDVVGENYTVANATTDTFSLRNIEDTGDVDSTEYGAYTEGGVAYGIIAEITGLSHLEGKEVSVLADAAIHPARTVSSGEILLNAWYNRVAVGLPVTAKARLMRTGMHYLKRINRIYINFVDTVSCKIGPTESDLTEIVFRFTEQDLTTPVPKFSGTREEPFSGNYDRDGFIWLVADSPAATTIVSVTADMAVYQGA